MAKFYAAKRIEHRICHGAVAQSHDVPPSEKGY
jgi:hypothetical protein